MKNFIPLFIMLFCLTGCKKKDDPTPVDPGLALSLAWRANLTWTVNGSATGDYSRLLFVTDRDTSDLYGGQRTTNLNFGNTSAVQLTSSGGTAGDYFVGIAFYDETAAGTALATNTTVYNLEIRDQTDATKTLAMAQGTFTRAQKSTSRVYYVGKLNINHSTTPSTYTFTKLANPFWLDNYDLSNYN